MALWRLKLAPAGRLVAPLSGLQVRDPVHRSPRCPGGGTPCNPGQERQIRGAHLLHTSASYGTLFPPNLRTSRHIHLQVGEEGVDGVEGLVHHQVELRGGGPAVDPQVLLWRGRLGLLLPWRIHVRVGQGWAGYLVSCGGRGGPAPAPSRWWTGSAGRRCRSPPCPTPAPGHPRPPS